MSDELVSSDRGYPGFGIAPSMGAECAPVECIPPDSLLCAILPDKCVDQQKSTKMSIFIHHICTGFFRLKFQGG